MTANVDLRPYQRDLVLAAERELCTHRSVLIQACTGAGKTRVSMAVVARALAAGGRALVTAHRRELLDQLEAAARLFGLTTTRLVGRWASAQVTIASIQTLARRLDWLPENAFRIVLVDECHHCAAASYMRVLSHFPTARILGVTATPMRADGVSLGVAFDTCAGTYPIDRAIKEGYLCPIRALRVEVPGMDLSEVRTRTRASSGRYPSTEGAETFTDLHPGDLGKAVIAPEAVEGVVVPLLQLTTREGGAKEDLPTIVFAVDRRHAAAISRSINARRSGSSAVVTRDTPNRKEILDAFRDGKIQYLVNVMVLTEGTDLPRCACVAIARPTQSQVLFIQATGRALRLFEGKKHALLLDFTGVSCTHDLVGPDDVFAGALLEPSRTIRGPLSKRQTRRVLDGYEPQNVAVRFGTRVVDVMRRGGKRVGGWLRNVLFGK